jgi:hypothetical protein
MMKHGNYFGARLLDFQVHWSDLALPASVQPHELPPTSGSTCLEENVNDQCTSLLLYKEKNRPPILSRSVSEDKLIKINEMENIQEIYTH